MLKLNKNIETFYYGWILFDCENMCENISFFIKILRHKKLNTVKWSGEGHTPEVPTIFE